MITKNNFYKTCFYKYNQDSRVVNWKVSSCLLEVVNKKTLNNTEMKQ